MKPLSDTNSLDNIDSRSREISVQTKICNKCGEVKDLSEYHVNRRFSDGLNRTCKTCYAAHRKEMYWSDPEKYRAKVRAGKHNAPGNPYKWAARLKSAYGLSPWMWEWMFSSQGGKCAICQTAAAEVVDHDHITGQVRGLLCHKCNRGLGHFGDDIEMTSRALEYLIDARDRGD